MQTVQPVLNRSSLFPFLRPLARSLVPLILARLDFALVLHSWVQMRLRRIARWAPLGRRLNMVTELDWYAAQNTDEFFGDSN